MRSASCHSLPALHQKVNKRERAQEGWEEEEGNEKGLSVRELKALPPFAVCYGDQHCCSFNAIVPVLAVHGSRVSGTVECIHLGVEGVAKSVVVAEATPLSTCGASICKCSDLS